MRARNEFNLFSDWSPQLQLNLSSFPVVTTGPVTTLTPPPNSPSASSSFPAFGTVLIVVVGVALILIVILLLVFFGLRLNHWMKMQQFKEEVRAGG